MLFPDVTAGNFESVKADWKIFKFGHESVQLRAVRRRSGNGRQDVVCYYPIEATITPEENAKRLLELMLRLSGIRDIPNILSQGLFTVKTEEIEHSQT